MTYTEIKKRNERNYYYRVLSVRKGGKVSKKRIYIGVNLNKNEVGLKEKEADERLLSSKQVSKELQKIMPKLRKILVDNKIKRAGVFGSYALGDFKRDSDIDILIQPTKNMSLMDFSRLKIEIQEKLGKRVDLLSYDGISPLLKKEILKSEVKVI